MGKGDKKSRKGKIFQGSYGITRPRKGKKYVAAAATAEGTTATTEKKTASKKVKKKEG